MFQLFLVFTICLCIDAKKVKIANKVVDKPDYVPIYPHEWPPEEIERRIKDDDVIPDVIDVSPTYVINVSYSPGLTVYFGNELEPEEVKNEPEVVTWPVQKDVNYTLILTGPDYPSVASPDYRSYLVWLVVDIPECEVLKGRTIAKYVPLDIPPDTGLHRFVFTLYKQPKGKVKWHESFMHDINDMNRVKFNNQKFSKKYGLGPPYAVNYFTAEPEVLDDAKGPPMFKKQTDKIKKHRLHEKHYYKPKS